MRIAVTGRIGKPCWYEGEPDQSYTGRMAHDM